jgi:hypothetical protein
MMHQLKSITTGSVAILALGGTAYGQLGRHEGDWPPKVAIAEVASQGQLDALEPSDLFDGWELRLAMAPGSMPDKAEKKGAAAEAAPNFTHSPWRILYADFRRTVKNARFPHDADRRLAEPLGPLCYQLSFDPDPKAAKVLEVEQIIDEKVIRCGEVREYRDRYLFAAVLPASGEGAYQLRIFANLHRSGDPFGKPKPTPVATARWKQDSAARMVWSDFANRGYAGDGIPVPDEMVKPFVPAAPDLDGYQCLLGEGKDVLKAGAGDSTPIPRMVPRDPDDGFTVSLAGAGIEIRLKSPGSTDIDSFLARWWIDGKPVGFTFDELDREPEELSEVWVDQDRSEFRTRVPFRAPDALSGAKPDSEITVQLLYCPMGTMRLPNPADFVMGALEELESIDPFVLRLSNKLKFRLRDVTDG